MPPMETYSQLIQAAARQLAAAGIDNPRREARLLVALAAEIDSAQLIAIEADKVTDAGTAVRLNAFVARRCKREPFAHISGRRAFYGMDLISDARALVPRPESEQVVDMALELLPRGQGLSVADLGAGSGCLLAAIAHTRGGVKGMAVERDPQAASLARENFKRYELEDRIQIFVMDWAKWDGWSEVDMIVSNPPYIASEQIASLDPDVRLFDPVQALDGGEDGLADYRTITAIGGERMKPGAWLVFEIGYDQDKAVQCILEAHGFTDIRSAKDLSGHDRVVAGRQP